MSTGTGKAVEPSSSPNSPTLPSKMAANAVSGFAAPIYRGSLNHGSVAELQEGFRILTHGQKTNIIPIKDLFAMMQGAGLHTSEEELHELLRVVHQDERTNGLEFSEFIELMTRKADDSFADGLRRAFAIFDKNKTGTVAKKQFTEIFVTMGEHSSAEEMEELMLLAESSEETDRIDYNAFISELMIRLNKV